MTEHLALLSFSSLPLCHRAVLDKKKGTCLILNSLFARETLTSSYHGALDTHTLLVSRHLSTDLGPMEQLQKQGDPILLLAYIASPVGLHAHNLRLFLHVKRHFSSHLKILLGLGDKRDRGRSAEQPLLPLHLTYLPVSACPSLLAPALRAVRPHKSVVTSSESLPWSLVPFLSHTFFGALPVPDTLQFGRGRVST